MDIKELTIPEGLPEEFEEFHFTLLRRNIIDKKTGIHVIHDDLVNLERRDKILKFIQWTVQEKLNEKGVRRSEKRYMLFSIDNEKNENIIRDDSRVVPIKLSTKDARDIQSTDEFIEELKRNREKIYASRASYIRRYSCPKKEIAMVLFYPDLIAQINRANFVNLDGKFVAYKEAKEIFKDFIVITIEDNSFLNKK